MAKLYSLLFIAIAHTTHPAQNVSVIEKNRINATIETLLNECDANQKNVPHLIALTALYKKSTNPTYELPLTHCSQYYQSAINHGLMNNDGTIPQAVIDTICSDWPHGIVIFEEPMITVNVKAEETSKYIKEEKYE